MTRLTQVAWGVLALTILLVTAAATTRSASDVKWEYKAIELPFAPVNQVEAALNRLGLDGWELVSDGVTPVNTHLFVLKRTTR